MKHRIGLYTGSFDPITRGHAGVIRKAALLVDELIIGVGVNASKTPLFTLEERVELIQQVAKPLLAGSDCTLSVIAFTGLAYRKAEELGASVILRGMRNTTDFNEENAYGGMFGDKAPNIPVVWLPSDPGTSHIASSLVKQAAMLGDDVREWVPAIVADKLKTKFATK